MRGVVRAVNYLEEPSTGKRIKVIYRAGRRTGVVTHTVKRTQTADDIDPIINGHPQVRVGLG